MEAPPSPKRGRWFLPAILVSSIAAAAVAAGIVIVGPIQAGVSAAPLIVEPGPAATSPVTPEPAVTAPEPSPASQASEIFTAPTITIVPPPPPPPPAKKAAVPAMLAFVNAQRTAHGLNPLVWSSSLASKAQKHSNNMAAADVECSPGAAMAHYDLPPSPGGQNVATNYYQDAGGCAVSGLLSWTGSLNIADSNWMTSPEHRANILDPSWTKMGGGGTQSAFGVWYWTQDFGG